jgi:hypothetical protein
MRPLTAAAYFDITRFCQLSMSTVSHTSTIANEPTMTTTAVWDDKTPSSEIAQPEFTATHEHRYLHGYQLIVVTL